MGRRIVRLLAPLLLTPVDDTSGLNRPAIHYHDPAGQNLLFANIFNSPDLSWLVNVLYRWEYVQCIPVPQPTPS